MIALFLFNPGTVIVIPLLIVGIGFLIFRWSMLGILTLEYLKVLFGFVLLLMIVGTAALVVKEGNAMTPKAGEVFSQILTILSVLAGAYSQWAFSQPKEEVKRAVETGQVESHRQ